MEKISIPNDFSTWLGIFLFAVGFTLIIRLVHAFTKAIEIKFGGPEKKKELGLDGSFDKKEILGLIWLAFSCTSKVERVDDYFLPSFLGFLELLVYPVLMFNGHFTFIGAWLGLKTLAIWGKWTQSRVIYNRFLLGNLLNIIFSFVILKIFFK